ncbi:MAG: cellulose binding domain-containing protein [Clostridia bacterium]|nr:cellulose binding domain-containing protein [Clostridia bacterium]
MKDRIFIRLVSIFLAITIVIGIIPIRNVRADSVNRINEELSVTYQELSSWGDYTQAQVDIKNVSGSKIDGWQVKLTYEKYVAVSSIWNAVLCESDISSENALYIMNEDYNSVIEADQVVSFGLIIESGSEHLPTVEIVDCLEDLPTDDETELFSSAVFAGNDFNFSGWKANVYGRIYTGNNFNYQGSELYLYGSLDNGRYTSQVAGENVTEAITDGKTSTAYGDYKYTYEDLVNLFG